jgi:septal ring factor EnvC (AmiA/AmiB activator)
MSEVTPTYLRELTPGRKHERIAEMCDALDDAADRLEAQDRRIAELLETLEGAAYDIAKLEAQVKAQDRRIAELEAALVKIAEASGETFIRALANGVIS